MVIRAWLRWLVMHRLPELYLSRAARQGHPLAQILVGPDRGTDATPLAARIRDQGRIVRTPRIWVTADHEFCRTILRDRRFGVLTPTNRQLSTVMRTVISWTDLGLPNPIEPPSMLATNPPEHTRYRRLVGQAFTPRAVQRLNDRIGEVTTQLLDDLDGRRHADLIEDFAVRLPVAIIAEILGVPSDMQPTLLEWGNNGAVLLDRAVSWKIFRRAVRSLQEGEQYFDRHVQRLQADPGDDVLSKLVVGGELTRREQLANASVLLGAGFETTVNLIGNAIPLLLAHPEQLELLRAEPERWPSAIEEILRYDSPVQLTVRTASEDVELGGHTVRAGASVVLLLAGANRDPAVFTDPDRFDITRENAGEHLGFGGGIHSCLGASLARTEGVTALRALFDRYPALRLDGPPVRRGLVTLHGYSHLPVTLATIPAPA